MTSSARAKASTPGLPQGPALDSPLVPWRTSFRHGIIIIIFREFCAPRGSKLRRLSWAGDPPTSQAPTSRKQRQHAQEPRTREIDLFVLFDFRRRFLACS